MEDDGQKGMFSGKTVKAGPYKDHELNLHSFRL
jgi:hypothetical protein